ncbi:hypothetical protein [Capnocytophaga gingivalis]
MIYYYIIHIYTLFAYFYFLTSCAASTGAFRIACALFFPIISTSSH